jgi:hypothetical protein
MPRSRATCCSTNWGLINSGRGASLKAGFDMLAKMVRQSTDMMVANVKAAGDAGDKPTASVTPHPKKAA